MSNILKLVIYIQLYEQNNSEWAISFKKKCTTTTALVALYGQYFFNFYNKQISLTVLLDFSKASDTINHRLPVAKCHYYGNKSWTFIKTNHTSRSQIVVVNKQVSTLEKNGFWCTVELQA